MTGWRNPPTDQEVEAYWRWRAQNGKRIAKDELETSTDRISADRFAVFNNTLPTIDCDTPQSDADCEQANKLSLMINILARKERADPTFVGPPRPFKRGQDTFIPPGMKLTSTYHRR